MREFGTFCKSEHRQRCSHSFPLPVISRVTPVLLNRRATPRQSHHAFPLHLPLSSQPAPCPVLETLAARNVGQPAHRPRRRRVLTVGRARDAGIGVRRVVTSIRALVAVERVRAAGAQVALAALDASQVIGAPQTAGGS